MSSSVFRRTKKNQPAKTSLEIRRWRRRVGVLVIIAILGCTSYYLIPPVLAKWTTIHHVSITGVREMTRGEILSLLALPQTSSLTTIDTPSLERRLMAHPRIARASVGRVLPHTLAVVIEEREPVAVVQHAGGRLILDQEGAVISIASEGETPRLPVFTGLSAIKLLDGDPETGARAKLGVTVATLVQKQFREALQIDFRDPTGIIAMTKNVTFFVNQHIQEAWPQYVALVPTIHQNHPSTPYEIDLRYSDKVIVRQRG